MLLCMSPTSNPIFEMKAVCSFKVHSLPLVVTLHDESPVGIRDLWTCSGGWTFRPLFGESGRSRPGGKVSEGKRIVWPCLNAPGRIGGNQRLERKEVSNVDIRVSSRSTSHKA